MANTLVNVFFDHNTDSRRSLCLQVPDVDTHKTINEFWDALGDDYKCVSDCCCKACMRFSPLFDTLVSFELVEGDRLYGEACVIDNVTQHVLVAGAERDFFIPYGALVPNCECGNPFNLCHPDA